MVRIVELTIAGELVRLLAVLTAALTIALSGQTTVTAEWLAGLAESQHQIDEGKHVADAVTLLLWSAPGEHHRGRGLSHDMGCGYDVSRRYTSDPLNAIRPIGGNDAAHGLKAGCPSRNEVAVDQSVLDRDMHEAVRQCGVGSRRQLQMQRRVFGGH
jgi:hypothetical protein